eukprot:gene18509-11358_t
MSGNNYVLGEVSPKFSENLLRKARGGNSTINAASIVHDTTGTDGEYIDLANNDGNNHSGYLDIGGQDGANTNNNMVQGSYVGVSVQKLDVGIYGWHKTMLYAAIILLTVLAVVNIGLLTYIIKACAITADGAGPVKFGVGSLTIDGD